jgi:hypothetical protein
VGVLWSSPLTLAPRTTCPVGYPFHSSLFSYLSEISIDINAELNIEKVLEEPVFYRVEDDAVPDSQKRMRRNAMAPGAGCVHGATAALPDRNRCHEGGPATSVQRLPRGGLKIFFDRPRQEPPPLTSLVSRVGLARASSRDNINYPAC